VRVLHVSWGFSPWLGGGLVAYAEGLMAGQAARGHHVAGFIGGRHLPLARRPFIRRRRRGAVTVHELLNTPIPQHWSAGTLRPDRDLREPVSERWFSRVLARETPDIVHFQHLAGLPSSLIGLAAGAGARTVMTLEDYQPLCPTLKLYDSHGLICLRHDVGAECARCCREAPGDAAHLVEQTARHTLVAAKLRVPGLRRVSFGRAGHAVGGLPTRSAATAGGRPAPAAEYQRRREENVRRLDAVDLLIAQSPRLAEIYSALGVDNPSLTPLQLTLPHIERLTPRRLAAPPDPVTFATMNGAASPAKGARVLLEAARALQGERFRLLVLGQVHAPLRAEMAAIEGVELRGEYDAGDLDVLLGEVDVGLVPSVWEEAYGFVGPEFLAKGIPVIGSALGGIPEYVRDGETGWLNRSASASELAAHMRTAVRRPDEVLALHRQVVARRTELIKPMAAHLDEVDALYAQLLSS
jgi:glycosyltransferase involved in cell wall biosynthesis